MKSLKEISDLVGCSVEELVDVGINRVSSDSLNKLARENVKKYEMQILGIVCMKLGISVDELKLFAQLKKIMSSGIKR